jgi:hypothetical protein
VLVELESGARVEMPIPDVATGKKETHGKKRKG